MSSRSIRGLLKVGMEGSTSDSPSPGAGRRRGLRFGEPIALHLLCLSRGDSEKHREYNEGCGSHLLGDTS